MTIKTNAASKNQGPPEEPAVPASKPRRRKGQPKPEKPDLEGAKWKKGFRPSKAKLKEEGTNMERIASAQRPAVHVREEKPTQSPIAAAGIHVIELEEEVPTMAPIPTAQRGPVVWGESGPAAKIAKEAAPAPATPQQRVRVSTPTGPVARRSAQATPAGAPPTSVVGRPPVNRVAKKAPVMDPREEEHEGDASPAASVPATSASSVPSAVPSRVGAAQPAAPAGADAQMTPEAAAPEPVAPEPTFRLPTRLPTKSMKAFHVVEAALFSAGKPISTDEIALETGLDKALVTKAIKELAKAYEDRDTVLEVGKAGAKWAMQVKTKAAEPAAKFAPMEIAPKLLKTLALIAYHQPMKQSELVDMIGTKVYDHIPELVERGLVKAREDGATKILLTTSTFPEYFGLDAASPEEIRAAMAKLVGLPPPPPKTEPRSKQGKLGDQVPDAAAAAETPEAAAGAAAAPAEPAAGDGSAAELHATAR